MTNGGDRHSVADEPYLIDDQDEIARREVENGITQFNLALELIRTHVKDRERPFRLRPMHVLQLHKAALEGIHRFAGTYRNTPVKIGKSKHEPVDALVVPEEVQQLCDYVNANWEQSAVHLGAYVLWRLNWIHPFPDGNGRTSRATSYVVLSMRSSTTRPEKQIAGA